MQKKKDKNLMKTDVKPMKQGSSCPGFSISITMVSGR